jgi:DNA polymerase elongation subunit (family B)
VTGVQTCALPIFRILSFDIECDSCDGQMPQANRSKDTIIQIGSTYTLLGQSEPYRQHIVTLNSCDNLPDAIVESYQDESELILGWIDEIKNSDADILTGYNIFYFDEKYIYDRSKLLGIDIDCSYFSKLKKHKCIFKETKLASSALGENLLRFYDSPGIVHIDLMKDVQKTYNLESYKLDRVASKFINGQVLKITQNDKNKKIYYLECNSVNDLHLNDFIHLELQESFVSDDIGEKFKVIELDVKNKLITIENNEGINLIKDCDFKRGKIVWSQAKDDVPPKEIFRLQHTDSKGRAIVAKYCLKDCKLVNLLINKLEVVTKNIEMANVCYVPFQFLFTRGQGIKLFSLCLKEFRNYGYLFPKMTALTDEEKEELGSYEGAIVFDPIPTVSYQAYAVKDYASLYPSSIIHKNMSHETKVVDEAYDNLEGVTYFNAKFNNDGKIEYRRFAKREGEFGVVPTILQKLLKERKAVKKEMEKTDDPFKKAILDAKQLALKVTANSLYGQLGAGTSPIRERDVAACTTSTGREMLILGRKFDEEILPWIMNGFYQAFKNEDDTLIKTLRECYFKEPNNDKLFEEIKSFCEETKNYLFHPMIKYGDSVIGDTPLLLRNINTNEIFIEKIKNLSKNQWSNYHQTKESYELNNLETWTEKGWTKIQRVIRHKIESNKKLLKIQTHQGVVVVTDEHSLLNEKANMIDAKNVKIGDTLLHSFPFLRNNLVDKKIYSTKDTKEALEFYYHLSQIDRNIKVNCDEDNNYTFEFTDNLTTEIQKITPWNYPEEYVYDLTTDNHHFHAGVGSIIVHNTDSVFSCYNLRENHSYVDDKPFKKELFEKIIKFGLTLIKPFMPTTLQEEFSELYQEYYAIKKLEMPDKLKPLSQPEHWKTVLPITDILKQFLKEYVEESLLPWIWTLHDFFKIDLTYLPPSEYEELLNIKIIKVGQSHINKMGLDRINLYPNEMIGQDRDDFIHKIKSFMKQIMKDYLIYPYLQLEKGKLKKKIDFYQGGKYIIDKRSLTHSIKLGIISGELIKKILPFPHDFEYEKTFYPYLILTKKRYVGHKYEFSDTKYKFDYNGIVLKRRDNAPIVKEVCSGIIKRLIEDRDPEGALKFTQDILKRMFDGEFDIKYFLQSRTLKMKESYADWTRIAHVVLSERIGVRDPGNKPQAGDRISFAAIKVKNSKGKLQGELIETPEFIKEQKLKIDYLFYLTNQIEKPALQFLSLVNPQAKEVFEDIKMMEENLKRGNVSILDYITSVNSYYDLN